MTQNALAARNNEAWGLGKKTSETLKDQLKKICKYYCDILESSREVIVIYKELREDEINVVNGVCGFRVAQKLRAFNDTA